MCEYGDCVHETVGESMQNEDEMSQLTFAKPGGTDRTLTNII